MLPRYECECVICDLSFNIQRALKLIPGLGIWLICCTGFLYACEWVITWVEPPKIHLKQFIAHVYGLRLLFDWNIITIYQKSAHSNMCGWRCCLPCGYEWNWGFGVGRKGHVQSEPSVCDDTKYLPSWCHATERSASADCHRISAHRPRKSHSTIVPDS